MPSRLRFSLPRFFWTTGGLVLFLLSGACRSVIPHEEVKNRTGKVLYGRKAESVKWWRDRQIKAQPAEQYAANRLAELTGPNQVKIIGKQGNSWVLVTTGNHLDVGSAVPVAADGYFLTAAHNSMPEIFTWNSRLEIVRRTVRVVWKGRKEKGEPDLAVLHVPVKLPAIMPLRNTGPIPEQMRLLTAGFGMGIEARSGGRVISCSDWKTVPGGARWREVRHDAPTAQGDSGGAVMDENGRLVGVSCLAVFRFAPRTLLYQDTVSDYQGVAVSPDPAWIDTNLLNYMDVRTGGKAFA